MNQYPITDKNNLQVINPTLASEWDYDKNYPLTPSDVLPHSGKKVWWRCKEGHEWQAFIYSRHEKGYKCPYCTGLRVIKGKTDLYTVYPNVAKEWDYEQNNETPENITAHSNKIFWWVCKNNHHWRSSVDRRTKGSKCPYCVGKKPIKGENDLLTTNPTLCKEWNYKKNKSNPDEYLPNSCKKVWWICQYGHEWETTINNRNLHNKNCPYCNGRHLLQGKNDLFSKCPELVKEWDYNKNNISPKQVAYKTHKKVWWLCENGHSYYSAISDRSNGCGCPECQTKSYGVKRCIECLNEYKNIRYKTELYAKYIDNNASLEIKLKRFDFAIYKKDKLIGIIEFDGIQHFKERKHWYSDINTVHNSDLQKNNFLRSNKIPFIRIKYDQINTIKEQISDFITNPEYYFNHFNMFLSDEEYYKNIFIHKEEQKQ